MLPQPAAVALWAYLIPRRAKKPITSTSTCTCLWSALRLLEDLVLTTMPHAADVNGKCPNSMGPSALSCGTTWCFFAPWCLRGYTRSNHLTGDRALCRRGVLSGSLVEHLGSLMRSIG
jgi:hypothetical protein